MGAIGKMKPQIASVEMLTESARRRANELKRNQDLNITRRTQRRFNILTALQDILGDGDNNNSDDSFSCDSLDDSVGPDMTFVTCDSVSEEAPQTPSERGQRYRRRGSIIDANAANVIYAPERDDAQQPSSFRKRDSRIGSTKPSRASRAFSNESTTSTPSYIKPSLASIVDDSPTSQSVSALDRSDRSERRKNRRSAGGSVRTPSPSKVTRVISSAHARLYADYDGDNNTDSVRSRRSSGSCQPTKSSGVGAKNKVPKSLCSPPLFSGAPNSSKPRKSKVSPEGTKQSRKDSITFPFPADDDKSVCSFQASSSSVMTIDDRPIPRRSSGASPSTTSSNHMSANGLSLSSHRRSDVPEGRPRSKSVSAQLPLVPNLLSPGPLLPRTSTRKSGSSGGGINNNNNNNADLRRRITITALPMGNFEVPMSPAGSVCSEPCIKAGGNNSTTSTTKRNSKVVSPLLKKRVSANVTSSSNSSAHLRPPMTPRSSLPRNSVTSWDAAMLAAIEG